MSRAVSQSLLGVAGIPAQRKKMSILLIFHRDFSSSFSNTTESSKKEQVLKQNCVVDLQYWCLRVVLLDSLSTHFKSAVLPPSELWAIKKWRDISNASAEVSKYI